MKYYAKKVENAYPEHSTLNLLPHLSLASICDILRIPQEYENLRYAMESSQNLTDPKFKVSCQI